MAAVTYRGKVYDVGVMNPNVACIQTAGAVGAPDNCDEITMARFDSDIARVTAKKTRLAAALAETQARFDAEEAAETALIALRATATADPA